MPISFYILCSSALRLRIPVFTLVFVACACLLLSCDTTSDEAQVQTATDPSEFTPFADAPRTVLYGPYVLKVTADSAVIAWEEETRAGGLRHVTVPVSGLSSGTRYWYRVNGSSRDGRFSTAPADAAPFSFFIIGDTQTGFEVSRRIADMMLRIDPEAAFILHTGDLVGSGSDPEAWVREWWEPLSDVLTAMPVYPAMGNHDDGSPWFERYFGVLYDDSPGYAFTWGAVRIILFNLLDTGSVDPEHLAWITQQLEQSREAGFTIISHHLPLYYGTTSADDEGAAPAAAVLGSLYAKHGANLVLHGHLHGYQHHLVDSVRYVISAGGGGRLYEPGLPLEGRTLHMRTTHNFSWCRVSGSSIHVTTYDQNGNSLDSFEIVQHTPPDIRARVLVEADTSEVRPGDRIALDILLSGVNDISEMVLRLNVHRDQPPIRLDVVDADPEADGIQIEAGDTGGRVLVNTADPATGRITYHETAVSGLAESPTRVATVHCSIPEDARVTAFNVVPCAVLTDANGATIEHFMGGTRITITR
jgi:3',5'-cyclic AMP phosphodiesterase CpdA